MTYFISDVHGEYCLFFRLLDKIKFSPADRLYVLGDMIDKGNESVRLLNAVSSMTDASCIIGNHEYYFLNYYRAVMRETHDGFDEVLNRLQAYFPSDTARLTWEILDWMDRLPHFVCSKGFVGVHAGVPLFPDGTLKPLEKNPIEDFVYDRNFKNPKTLVNDDRTVLFGHTPTCYFNGTGEIILYPRRNGKGYSRVHLDTGVALTGLLGCFCLETGECLYERKEEI